MLLSKEIMIELWSLGYPQRLAVGIISLICLIITIWLGFRHIAKQNEEWDRIN